MKLQAVAYLFVLQLLLQITPIALIAGSEVSGISPELLEAAHQTAHIEMYGTNSSMNVVQATAIGLYELTGKLS